MRIFIFISLLLTVLMTFLGNPAPISIQLTDLFLITLPFLIGTITLATTHHSLIGHDESHLLFAVVLYLSYLFISFLIGLMHGIPILNVLRSVGPYLNFFPLLLIGFLPIKTLRPPMIGIILIAVGIVQIGYLFYLYISHGSNIQNTLGVLVNRITLKDPRTTLPILLAVTTLPLFFAFGTENKNNKQILLNILSFSLILIGLFAGMVTLTRAIFLSIIFGWVAFIFFYLYYQSKIYAASLFLLLTKVIFVISIFILILVVLSFVPKIQLLESGLLSRFSHSASSGDYSNGRLYDEWLPALTKWFNLDFLSLFFGIGAGNTFTVLSGEERTYIHNLSIYTLVYGGFYGFFCCLWLYFTLLKTLIRRATQTKNIIYLTFSALLASMFFYAQLFAVHKGLAFNAMLFIIIGLALKPSTQDT